MNTPLSGFKLWGETLPIPARGNDNDPRGASTIDAVVPKRALLTEARCCRLAAMLEADAGVTRSTRRRVLSAGPPAPAAIEVALAGLSSSTAVATIRLA